MAQKPLLQSKHSFTKPLALIYSHNCIITRSYYTQVVLLILLIYFHTYSGLHKNTHILLFFLPLQLHNFWNVLVFLYQKVHKLLIAVSYTDFFFLEILSFLKFPFLSIYRTMVPRSTHRSVLPSSYKPHRVENSSHLFHITSFTPIFTRITFFHKRTTCWRTAHLSPGDLTGNKPRPVLCEIWYLIIQQKKKNMHFYQYLIWIFSGCVRVH